MLVYLLVYLLFLAITTHTSAHEHNALVYLLSLAIITHTSAHEHTALAALLMYNYSHKRAHFYSTNRYIL